MTSVYKDILDDFFGMKLENSINDAMMEFSYKFPYEGMKEYSLEICDIPFSVFLEYINKYQDNNDISADCVSQFSKLDDCLLGFCEATDNMRRPLTFEEIGERLQDDGVNRNSVANTKYGENHAKVALQFGLAQCRYNYWYISALGKVFSQLSQTKRDALMIRTLLRNKLYALIFTRLQTQDVSIESILQKVNISESTRTRRLSSVKRILTWFFGVLSAGEFSYHYKVIECPLLNRQNENLPVNYIRRSHILIPKQRKDLRNFVSLSASENDYHTYSDLYLEQILRIPYLTKEDEKKYFEQYLAGDERARDAIVEAYLPTIYNIAKRYVTKSPNLDIQDLIGEGVFALCNAIKYYDPSSPARLITYAIHGIRGIMNYYTANNRLVCLRYNLLDLHEKIHAANDRFEKIFEYKPSVEVLAGILDIPADKVADLLKISGDSFSLDEYENIDLLEDENSSSDIFLLDSLSQEINCALETLTPREVTIVRKFYGIGVEEKTLEEIGVELDLTRERVRQIKEKAVRKLKASSRSGILKTYLGAVPSYQLETNDKVENSNKDIPEESNKQPIDANQTSNATNVDFIGTKVKITSGAFNDFEGSIDEITFKERKLKVVVTIFERQTPLELGFDQVIAYDQALQDLINESLKTPIQQTSHQITEKKVTSTRAKVVEKKVEKIKYKHKYGTNDVHVVEYKGYGTEEIIPPFVDLNNSDYRVIGITNRAFALSKLLESIKLPDTLVMIDERSFQDCINLKNIELPTSLTSIGDYAFMGCKSLTSVVIPNKLKKLGCSAFSGCTALSSISLSENIRTIEPYTFCDCRMLNSIDIPSKVSMIEYFAFSNCDALTTINLPERLTFIGARAFEHCISLKEIEIPSNVRAISKFAFANCTTLESIILPSTLTKIGGHIFDGCTSLKQILIPEGKTKFYCKLGLEPYKDKICEKRNRNHVLDKYINLFANLNRSKLNNELAPHKPVLLLALIDYIEDKLLLADGWERIKHPIPFRPELQIQFNHRWEKHVHSEVFKPSYVNPIIHMQNEPFYKLIPYPDRISFGTHSLMGIESDFQGIQLDNELMQLIISPDTRERLRQVLIDMI